MKLSLESCRFLPEPLHTLYNCPSWVIWSQALSLSGHTWQEHASWHVILSHSLLNRYIHTYMYLWPLYTHSCNFSYHKHPSKHTHAHTHTTNATTVQSLRFSTAGGLSFLHRGERERDGACVFNGSLCEILNRLRSWMQQLSEACSWQGGGGGRGGWGGRLGVLRLKYH